MRVRVSVTLQHKGYAVHTYDWVPCFCMLHRWNASFFCELLGNRTILLVGDSTMEQSVSTLMAMIQSGQGGSADQISKHAAVIICTLV